MSTSSLRYNWSWSVRILYTNGIGLYQELMSSEVTKECVTTAYAWVPSKSKSFSQLRLGAIHIQII